MSVEVHIMTHEVAPPPVTAGATDMLRTVTRKLLVWRLRELCSDAAVFRRSLYLMPIMLSCGAQY